jgi:multidrug efflux system membrane fusion protein
MRFMPMQYAMLAVLALTAAGCGRRDADVEVIRPALVVQVQTVDSAVNAYAGEVRARYEPALGFRIPGKIARRLVDAGAQVAAGQVLAELDAADVRLQAQASEAQWQAAKADLELARAERERAAALLDRKLVSQSVFDTRDSNWRAAQARAQQAQAQADVARNQADYAQLKAPKAGVIAARHAEAGQVVAAGQAVFTLAEQGDREIAIAIPEQQIAHLQIGQAVTVELWAQPGSRFPGRVRELSPAADPQTRTYAARVALGAGATLAELGQTARVYAAEAGAKAVSALPLSAVTAESGAAFVWTVDPATSQVHRLPVTIGAYRENDVPILDGLHSGAWVVAGGTHLLREGQKVRPVDRANRPVALTATP